MRTAAAAALAAVLFLACAAPRPAPQAQQPLPPAGPANFELEAYEIPESVEADTPEFFAVYVDSEYRGRTDIAPKSQRKRWLAELPEGNHLMRFEVCDSTDGVSGVPRPADAQPRERFVRVAPGERTRVVLKGTERGRQFVFEVAREPR